MKLTPEEQPLAPFGSYEKAAGQFIWTHTIALNPDGAIYIGEVEIGMRIQKFIK